MDDAMVNTLSLVPGNPESMHETLRDVMCSLRILYFAAPGRRTGRCQRNLATFDAQTQFFSDKINAC